MFQGDESENKLEVHSPTNIPLVRVYIKYVNLLPFSLLSFCGDNGSLSVYTTPSSSTTTIILLFSLAHSLCLPPLSFFPSSPPPSPGPKRPSPSPPAAT